MKSINEGPFLIERFQILLLARELRVQFKGPVYQRIYSLINHYTDAKDIFFSGTCEDDSGGETIHGYYVRFTKLINDMRNIKMTMPRMQLNSKFVNNMLLCGNMRYMIMRIEQMMEWFPATKLIDPLALSVNCSVLNGRVVVQDVRGRYNANNQGRPIQRNNTRGNVVAGNVGGQNRGGIVNPGQAKPIKRMVLYWDEETVVVFLQENRVSNFDDDVDESTDNDLALNVDNIFEADQCDAFDSDVDEAPNVQTMFMVNLSSEDPIYDKPGHHMTRITSFESTRT
ncbi:hypothetical protein Tco_0769181 [Tanacetum coccineum]|uniref:Polyprotein n=1 Tax=Tanacetum coccineum TaxID=301880 RepID=A0ABQ4ZBY4_9ASTR